MSKNQITPIGRVSFPHLFEPTINDQGRKSWSVVLVFDKAAQDTDEFKQMVAAVEATATERFGQKVPSGVKRKSLEPKSGYPFTATSAKEKYFSWAEDGSVMVTLSSRYAPLVIDRDKSELLEAETVYSGCYARAAYSCYSYSASGNEGVSFGLRALQKVKDGDALGSARAEASDFDDIDDSF